MRAGTLLSWLSVGALAAGCGSSGGPGSTTLDASTGATGTGVGGAGNTGGNTGSTGGGSVGVGGGTVALPTLDADGCPTLGGVGAVTDARTPVPAGVTTTYYVSAAGSDSNAGTDQAHPLASLSAVQALADAGTLAAGTAVLFRAGDVFHGTLALQKKNAGTATAPLVLGAYGAGPAPALVGTQVIPAASFTFDGARFVAPLTVTPARLFFGAGEVFPARFPNPVADEGASVVRTLAGTSTTLDVDAASVMALPLQGAHAWVRTESWRRDRVRVDAVATSGTKLTLTVSKTEAEPGGPTGAAKGLSTPATIGSGVFFEGRLEYLDAAGEWAVSGGKLYLRPPADADIAAQPVEITLPGPVIGATGVANLVVQDLHVDRGEGSGVYVTVDGAGPTVRNTLVTAPYYAGIKVEGAPAPILTGNTVTGSRNVGISVSGAIGGRIADNEVASGGVGPYATYGAGIILAFGSGNLIDHNSVHDQGQLGVGFGQTSGTTATRNVVVRSPSYFGDAGAFYWNFDGGGQTVDHNVVCKTSWNIADARPGAVGPTQGIYLDDEVRPAVIRQNTVLNAGFCGLHVVSQGTDVDQPGGPPVPSHTIEDNLFLGNGLHAGQGGEGAQVCYAHAKETTSGANGDTLGKLRSLHGNQLVATQRWQRALLMTSYQANHDFGVIDANMFAEPLSQAVVYDTSPGTPTALLSLDAWRLASGGKDATSTLGAPQRTECDLVSIDGADLVPSTLPWLGTSDVGATGIHLAAPPSGMTAWIQNAQAIPMSAGTSYLVEVTTSSPAPLVFDLYLHGVTGAPDAATVIHGLVSDPTPRRHTFVVTGAPAGAQLQLVAGAALTLETLRVRAVTTTDCAVSIADRLRVVTNTTEATQTYAVGAGWLDLSGAAAPSSVTVKSFESVVLQRATLAF